MPTQIPKPQSIEELRRRYDDLKDAKTRAETNFENAQKELDREKVFAKSQWGTDDLEELRNKLKEMEEENERKRREYQGQLDAIEADLKSVEEKFTQSQEQQ
ncbi:MAG TPA: hypothetical protein VHY37_04255 [Tepidisphaeraceae bacterium]|jgi:phage shock protein A|nr:hypothetical protein [Tepidisphaeraceae bacterium]